MDDRESHLLAVMHVCGFDAKPADAALILDQLAIPALDRSWEALADRNGKLAARIVALEAERDRLATLVDQIVEVWDSDGQWIRGEFEVLMDTARALVGRPDCRCLDDGEVLDQRDCPLHGCDCADDQSFHDIDCPARLPLPAAPEEPKS